jgi:hypothetical protein
MRVRQTLVAAAAVCALLWLSAVAGLYAAMRQPPETFGAIMSRMPQVAMMVLPFKQLWMCARAGHLRIGDRAQDFSLRPLHGNERVTLSHQYRDKPVVLIFGSYT